MTHKLGALTISQSPRHDLLAPLKSVFPEQDIIEVGALDALDTMSLPDGSNAFYPLTTTLKNGQNVTLDRDFLAPLVQDALNKLESKGVAVSVLLCAGDFPHLQGKRLLVKPTDIAQAVLRAMGLKHLAIMSPIAIQNRPIAEKWDRAGFDARVWTMPADMTITQQAGWINSQLAYNPDVACVVLDYVGYPTDAMLTLQKQVNKPLFELGHLAISALATLL